MANVKVFCEKCDLELDRWPWPWYDRKVLPQGIHIRNMKTLSPIIPKLWPMLMIFTDRQMAKSVFPPTHIPKKIYHEGA